MIYTDTRDSSAKVDFKTAVMSGMSSVTGGLYVPVEFPKIDLSKICVGSKPDFLKAAFEMAKPYVEGEIPDADLEALVKDAYPFEPKLVKIEDGTYVLELFHGPTCAFKDFGARFMARAMSFFNKDQGSNLHILVATSGDTGSAVGSAFHNVPGLDVTILYPEGKISPLQEKQLSTFTGNVRALKVKGTFDDCQKLVKTAFTDKDLRAKFRLSSANSINISRLLRQLNKHFPPFAAGLLLHVRLAFGPGGKPRKGNRSHSSKRKLWKPHIRPNRARNGRSDNRLCGGD